MDTRVEEIVSEFRETHKDADEALSDAEEQFRKMDELFNDLHEQVEVITNERDGYKEDNEKLERALFETVPEILKDVERGSHSIEEVIERVRNVEWSR